jgi:hypothetical protein
MLFSDVEPSAEILLPAQLVALGQRRKTSASERLALAVVSQAVNDITLYRYARYSWSRRVYRDAWRWIFSNDRSYAFSYVNLCEALGLSPTAVRKAVNGIVKRQEEAEALRKKAA